MIIENDHPVARLVHISATAGELFRLQEVRHRPSPEPSCDRSLVMDRCSVAKEHQVPWKDSLNTH